MPMMMIINSIFFSLQVKKAVGGSARGMALYEDDVRSHTTWQNQICKRNKCVIQNVKVFISYLTRKTFFLIVNKSHKNSAEDCCLSDVLLWIL